LRFSPDGRVLAFARRLQEHSAVCLWDVAARRLRTVLEQQSGPLAFSPDGQLLATTSADYCPLRVKVWAVATGNEGLQLKHPPVHWRDDKDLVYEVSCLAFSTDSKTLGLLGWIGAPDDKGVEQIMRGAYESDEPSHLARLWDMASGQVRCERPLYGPNIAALPQAPWEDVRLLGPRVTLEEEQVCDPLTGVALLAVPVLGRGDYGCYCGYEGPAYSVIPTAAGRTVLVAQDGGLRPAWLEWLPLLKAPPSTLRTNLRIHHGVSGRRLATILGQYIGCLSPDGDLLATHNEDGTLIQVWELPPPRRWLVLLGWATLPALLTGLLGIWFVRRSARDSAGVDYSWARYAGVGSPTLARMGPRRSSARGRKALLSSAVVANPFPSGSIGFRAGDRIRPTGSR
jgi:WD40 repeat protein